MTEHMGNDAFGAGEEQDTRGSARTLSRQPCERIRAEFRLTNQTFRRILQISYSSALLLYRERELCILLCMPFLCVLLYMATPARPTVSNFKSRISSARWSSSGTSQLAQTNFPFKNLASFEASHTQKCPGNSTINDNISPRQRLRVSVSS